MRTIGLIPARGGSKRLPGKNLRYLGGKHLIEWTIEAAMASRLDGVYVSTEDCDIKRICSAYEGLHVIDRPDALADDLTTTEDVVTHALSEVYCTRVMVLQCTTPERTAKHIDDVLSIGRTCKSVDTDGKPNGGIYLMSADDPWRFDIHYVRDWVDIDTIVDFQLAEARLT